MTTPSIQLTCRSRHMMDENDDGEDRHIEQGQTAELIGMDGKYGYHVGCPATGATAFYSEEDFRYYYEITTAHTLRLAAQRALPWIGKLIAEGAHMHSVCPNDAVGAMDQLEAAIVQAGGKP